MRSPAADCAPPDAASNLRPQISILLAAAEQSEPVRGNFSDVGLDHMAPSTENLSKITNDDDQIAG